MSKEIVCVRDLNEVAASSFSSANNSKKGFEYRRVYHKGSVLKDALVAIGESLKESEVILITFGALGEEYKSFVTSITIRYDPAMTFASLCKLHMDKEMWI